MSKLRLHNSSQNQAETSTEMDGDVIMERYQQSSRRYNEIEDDFVQLGFSALERNSILNDEDGRRYHEGHEYPEQVLHWEEGGLQQRQL